jgi:hypothetical protein
MPASNVTRVRNDGRWNSSASVRPVRGSEAWRREARNSALRAVARSKSWAHSLGETSAADRKSRPRKEVRKGSTAVTG